MFKGFEELKELMAETNKSIDKVIEWMIDHKEDEFFKTDEGKKLNEHICDMGWNHAMIYGDFSRICLKEFNSMINEHNKSYVGS